MNNLTTVQANLISNREYWDKRLLAMIKLESTNFVFSNLGVMRDIPKNSGTTTYSARRYNSLPVRSLATPQAANAASEKLLEGSANAPLKAEAQKVTATLDQFGAWMKVTDRVEDIHLDSIRQVYQPELARHAAEVKERNIISKFSDASEYYVDGTSTASYELGSDDVLSMKALRKIALAMRIHRRQGHSKFGGKPVTVLHSVVMEDLLDDADLKDRLLLPGNENLPIKLGTLKGYQFYGMYVIESLIAETVSAHADKYADLVADEKTAATVAALQALTSTTVAVDDLYACAADGKIYKCATATASASTWAAVTTYDFTVYTSYMLGKDPYVVLTLGNSGVSWHSTGFEAEKTDPLGQIATFGYKMYTGAKVIDPIAIVKIYSRSPYDVANDIFDSDDLMDNASQA